MEVRFFSVDVFVKRFFSTKKKLSFVNLNYEEERKWNEQKYVLILFNDTV